MNLTRKLHLKRLDSIRAVSTVADLLTKYTEKLSNEKISEPEPSVRHILAHVLEIKNLDEIDQNLTQQVPEDKIKELETLIYARLAHMPVQ